MGKIKGIIFDFDGVIVKQTLDFAAIKIEIFGSTDGYLLEKIEALKGEAQIRAMEILESHEKEAAQKAELNDGISKLFQILDEKKLKRAIVTRNCRDSVTCVQERFKIPLGVIVTREDASPKPSPEPVLLACRMMNIKPDEALMVGDFELDMLAGKSAGVRTVFIKNQRQIKSDNADYAVGSIPELIELLDNLGT